MCIRDRVATAPDFYGVPGRTVEIANVMARIPGRASTGSILLMAHYDSVDTTPGANDNAAAVAALLETARALVAGEPLRNDVIFLATDAEEPEGRAGATAFVNDHPWATEIAVAINLEAAGGSGPSLLVEAPSPNRWLIDLYREATSRPVAYSFLPDMVSAIGDVGTDFDVFRNRGTPGFHFAYTLNSPIYHTMNDNPAAVSRRSLQHHCDHTFGLATALGDLDLRTAPPDGDLVFFSVGPWLVTYPTGLGSLSAVVAAIGLASAALVVRRRRRLRPGSVIGAGLRTLGGAIAAGLVAAVIWTAYTGIRSTPGVVESYLYLGLFVALAGAAIDAFHRIRRRSTNASEHAVAVIGLWAALALIVGLVAPATGYLFVWPAIAAAVTVGAGALLSPARTWQRWALATFVAVPTMVVMVPAVDVFFQFAMPRPGNPDSTIPAMIAVAVLLSGMTLELLRRSTALDVWTAGNTTHTGAGAEIPLQ